MPNIPYSVTVSNIPEIFSKIREISTPTTFTIKDLPVLGLKSSNDRVLISILKFLNFIDSSNKPTELWNKYKDKNQSKAIMATAIREGYKELYSLYPDAEKKDADTIVNFFTSKYGSGKRVAEQTQKTFKYLCDLADFNTDEAQELAPQSNPQNTFSKKVNETILQDIKPITINLNIQLQLPATENSDIYDNLFASMKKHLFNN